MTFGVNPFMKTMNIPVLFLLICPLVYSFDHTVSIGILGEVREQKGDEAFLKLIQEVKAVTGSEVTVTYDPAFFLPSENKIEQSEQNYQFLVQSPEIDIILAYGPINNFVLSKKTSFPKPVILFGVVNAESISLYETDKIKAVPNLCRILTPFSFKRDLESFYNIFPFKKVGVVLDRTLEAFYPIRDNLDQIAHSLSVNCQTIYADDVHFHDKLKQVDAVYLASMNQTESGFLKMLQEINKLKLPSFAAYSYQSDQASVLISASPKEAQGRIIRRLALNFEAIINGTPPSEIPAVIDFNSELTLNLETAFEIGFPLRVSVLMDVNLEGHADRLSADHTYNLLEVMETTVRKNLDLSAGKRNVELAANEKAIARSEYLPDVSLNASSSALDPDIAAISGGTRPRYTTDGSLVFEQLIFSENANGAVRVNSELEKASRSTYQALELDTVLNACVAYFKSLIAKTNFVLNVENLRVTRKNYQIAEQQYTAGQIGKADVLRWRSELADSNQQVVTSFNDMNSALQELNFVLNNPINMRIDVEDARLNSDIFSNYSHLQLLDVVDDPVLREKFIDVLHEMALKRTPELQSLIYNIRSVREIAEMYRRSRYLPQLSFRGLYNQNVSTGGEGSVYPIGAAEPPDGYYNLTLNFSLPVFQKKQHRLKMSQARIQKDQMEINRSKLELEIRKQISKTILALINQIASIELSKISAESAKESLGLMQTAYANGATTITTLIDAQRAYLQARLTESNANYQFLLSSLQLERIIAHFFLLHSEQENQAMVDYIKNRLLEPR
ncbi:MAG: hypothetical protein CSA81_09520 [Acidobacteria bacterium]|nr:MAG: hypothetical protein CSA81_09520 [Acidobacteriota bacterium]